LRFLPTDLHSRIEEDHPARAIWAVIETLDLPKFESPIAARGETAGRPAIDPRTLLALWLDATSEGVASARQVERLCDTLHAYPWI
jgi:transposase